MLRELIRSARPAPASVPLLSLRLLFSPLVLGILGALACSSSHDAGTGDAGGDAGGAIDQGGDTGTPCASHDECVVVPQSCCGRCGAPTAGDAIAVHVDDASTVREAACADDAICPRCAALPEPELLASCIESVCTLVDLRMHPELTSCEGDGDCRLRTTACCTCGSTFSFENTVAISGSGIESFVCDGPAVCPACEPAPPPADEVRAACDEGTCDAVWGAP